MAKAASDYMARAEKSAKIAEKLLEDGITVAAEGAIRIAEFWQRLGEYYRDLERDEERAEEIAKTREMIESHQAGLEGLVKEAREVAGLPEHRKASKKISDDLDTAAKQMGL